MKIELLYDKACPNVVAARERLREALAQEGLPPAWVEWDQADSAGPAHVRRYGSPTILVDGRDVSGARPSDAVESCRLYRDAEGLHGVPSVNAIRVAIARGGAGRGVWASLAGIGAAGAGLMPVLTCPACWPGYTALLGSLGAGFLADRAYLLPVTAVLLAMALVGFAWSSHRRGRYAPFVLALAGSVLLLVGRYAFDLDAIAYGGVAMLIAASIWNIASMGWRRDRRPASCCACEGDHAPRTPLTRKAMT